MPEREQQHQRPEEQPADMKRKMNHFAVMGAGCTPSRSSSASSAA